MFSFLTPYLGKLAIGAAILAAIVAGCLYVSNLRAALRAADATIAADSAKCANTQLAVAASVNANTQTAVDTQRQALDAATSSLGTATTASQSAGAATLATITVQAAQPAQDGPIAPVLQSAITAIRSQP